MGFTGVKVALSQQSNGWSHDWFVRDAVSWDKGGWTVLSRAPYFLTQKREDRWGKAGKILGNDKIQREGVATSCHMTPCHRAANLSNP